MSCDTIYAFASGVGRAAIGVFRISGPKTRAVVEAMAGSLPQPRYARLTSFIDPQTKEILDQGLLLWFPAPASFTGEDCAEFHVHGGQALASAVAQAIARMPEVRLALPGEFTRQAFFNGKLDLSSVEGLADLVDAETEAQRRQALRQMAGNLKEQALLWRSSLLEAAALIEGEIDFSDEADVPKHITARVFDLLTPVLSDLQRELNSRVAERIRDGLTIVIAGPPNAGKSTLLNALARRDIAIVSEYAGTTRDLLEVHLDIDGLPVTLIDTAGLRESTDPIEQIGMSRARQRSKDADLVMWLSEKEWLTAPDPALAPEKLWIIVTKSDLADSGDRPATSFFEPASSALPQEESDKKCAMLSISAATGENLDLLIEKIGDFARAATSNQETGLITRERHRQAFQLAASALERITFNFAKPIEFLAEDLRMATRALESLVGGVDVEDVLGEIFSRFCVGK
jgi:tRNA modification GTPase